MAHVTLARRSPGPSLRIFVDALGRVVEVPADGAVVLSEAEVPAIAAVLQADASLAADLQLVPVGDPARPGESAKKGKE